MGGGGLGRELLFFFSLSLVSFMSACFRFWVSTHLISDYVWHISMQIEFKSSRGILAHHVQIDRYAIDKSLPFIVSHNLDESKQSSKRCL